MLPGDFELYDISDSAAGILKRAMESPLSDAHRCVHAVLPSVS